MNGGKKPLGYTIVEVMIVLAVSGMMFFLASTFISGKQGKTAFAQGSNEVASRIQDVIEQVTDGQYSDIPLNCTFDGTTTSPNLPGARAQGTNNQCVFLGKLLHFSAGGNPVKYETFSIAGGRVKPVSLIEDVAVTDLIAADPKVISLLTVKQDIPQQFQVGNIVVQDDQGGTPTQSYMVGFFQGLGVVDNAGALKNGAQGVSVYYVNGAVGANNVESQIHNNLVRAGKVQICITDQKRWAIISLGNSDSATGNTNSQLNVDTQIYGNQRPSIC